MTFREQWDALKVALRWNIASRLLTLLIRLTHEEMPRSMADAGMKFLSEFREANQRINGP